MANSLDMRFSKIVVGSKLTCARALATTTAVLTLSTFLGTAILLPCIAQADSFDISSSSRYQQRGDVVVVSNNISRTILITESFCKECDLMKRFLKNNSVEFEEQQSGFFVRGIIGTLLYGEDKPPVLLIYYRNGSNKKIIGYDEDILRTIFGRQESPSPIGNQPSSNSEFDLR